MSTTIVDRILSEYNARKATRDAILGKGSHSPTAPALPAAPPRPAAHEADVLSRFRNECIPVIGRAVSSEIASALEKVREDLLSCLKKELVRTSAPPRRVLPLDEVELDSKDTDLDLPTDEVNRQLDQVFAVMEAQGPSLPEVRAFEPRPARPEFPEPADIEGSEQPTEDLAADAESALGAAVQAIPVRAEAHLPLPEPPRRSSAPPPAAREAAAAPAAFAPARPAPNDDRVLHEFREAVIPGIADGISKILSEVEKGQEAIGRQVAQLAERVMGLETRSARPAPKPPEVEVRRPPPSRSREIEAAGPLAGLLGHLEEMERRIIERIDVLDLYPSRRGT